MFTERIALPPGVNFSNILQAAFTHADLKSAKKTVKLSVSLFALLGSALVKAARRTLIKLTLLLFGFGYFCLVFKEGGLAVVPASFLSSYQIKTFTKENLFVGMDRDSYLIILQMTSTKLYPFRYIVPFEI